MMKALLVALSIVLTAPATLRAGEIISEPPGMPNSDTHYVFYLHGQIVQDSGPRPTHPRWGLYDYPLILDSLALSDITVISERRTPGTDPTAYSDVIAGQVLSVFELSDASYSCLELAKRSPEPTSFDEFSIDTGKEHGAFYLPHDEWLQPVLEWILR